jgi:hypothetical protein
MEYSPSPTSAASGFSDHTVSLGDVDIHYQIGGSGSAVVLLHGYAETSHSSTSAISNRTPKISSASRRTD